MGIIDVVLLTIMCTYNQLVLLLLLFRTHVDASEESEEPILYYYGLDESERGLPVCAPRQACSALMRRYWRDAALVRLCRCGRAPRRLRCDAPAPTARRLPLNNRAHLQFCQPVDSWPVCEVGDTPLTIDTSTDHLNPDELEQLHHRKVHISPPKIVFNCRCREPNYWKLNSTNDSLNVYQCAPLPLCNTGEFCGNVNYELNSLYQSCLCPKRHICVHNGGIPNVYTSELMYNGRGWRAYCQRVDLDDSYEDY